MTRNKRFNDTSANGEGTVAPTRIPARGNETGDRRPPDFLTAEEGAVFLGISGSTFYRRARAHRLASKRVMGRVVYRRTDIAALTPEEG